MKASEIKTVGYFLNEDAQWSIITAQEALDNLCEMMAKNEDPAYALLSLIKAELQRGTDTFEIVRP
ncbi:hypothetical protein J2T38_001719 [Neisseria perflava]|uniref:hypothetical protein n=1 Tax=Neisseria perflava TaxID=33053 RepID=UPI0020A1B599|nr:hypothetical protein [Neisseria perflava]MCP1772883.1 hypothetical protein [Neisseria perflava]